MYDTNKNLTVIGSKEFVSLPKHGITSVPAKIDTGADSSAIWASDIREANGELSFTLFDKQSQFYTGERISLHDYEVTSVRNSFGHSEVRYGVTLLLKIARRRIVANFTLADRSRSTYPILIGNRTLRGKFLVDVHTNNRLKRKKQSRVLVLSTRWQKANERFFAAINQQFVDHLQCTYRTYDDFTIAIKGGLVTMYDQGGQSLEEYDLVYFKNYHKREEVAAAMAEYLTVKGIDFIDREVAAYRAKTKLSMYVKLALNDLQVPDTLFIPRAQLTEEAFLQLQTELRLPFILKSIRGTKGQDNHLVHSQADFKNVIKQASPDIEFVAQKFIAHESDLRILVLSKKIYMAIKRTVPKGMHITNTSRGGAAELVTSDSLLPEVRTACLQAAWVMQRQVAGVDIMQDKTTNTWYILEVQNAPQLASGAFVNEKTEAFGNFLRRYTNRVSLR